MESIEKMLKKILVLSVICISLLLAVVAPAHAVEYEYTELLPPGWFGATQISYSPAGNAMHHIINDNGVVVGTGWNTEIDSWGPPRGFIYSEGEYTELLPPEWEEAMVNSINNRGEVVGTGVKKQPEIMGFIYKDEIYTELLPSGLRDVTVSAINENGVALGAGYDIKNDTHKGFVYKSGKYTTMRSPLLPYTVGLRAINDINDFGTIVGTCSYGVPAWGVPGKTYGFVYRAGIYTWLLPKGSEYAEATAINNRGVVVGCVEDGAHVTGFIYRGGIYRWLNMPGKTVTWPRDINNRGEVVGYSGDSKGFVYSRGTYTELLPLGWIWAEAIAINNKGVVVGAGADGNQIDKMFIAVPKSN